MLRRRRRRRRGVCFRWGLNFVYNDLGWWKFKLNDYSENHRLPFDLEQIRANDCIAFKKHKSLTQLCFYSS
jgi:hypothetical protein